MSSRVRGIWPINWGLMTDSEGDQEGDRDHESSIDKHMLLCRCNSVSSLLCFRSQRDRLQSKPSGPPPRVATVRIRFQDGLCLQVLKPMGGSSDFLCISILSLNEIFTNTARSGGIRGVRARQSCARVGVPRPEGPSLHL